LDRRTSLSIGTDIFPTQEATLVDREGLRLHLPPGRILLDMRVTYDVEADAAYVYLTDEDLPRVETACHATHPRVSITRSS
jgi:hypothetical protein